MTPALAVPLTITQAARALRTGSISSVELVTEALARADRHDALLRVYTARFDETALRAAELADRELASGVDRGPLHGIPVGIKDIVYTSEAPTTGGSLVRNPAWEQRRDAPVVARLRAAGAVLTGKLTTLEFAFGEPDPGRPLTQGRTPWDADRWAGGSSSGSGSGVAAGMFLGAVGTDTGGSIRLPAAYCGITGLRPTWGRVPTEGVIPLAYSQDTVGPMARSAADVVAMLQVMAGLEAMPELGRSLEGLRIGVERKNHLYGEHVDAELRAAFEDAVGELERGGALVREVELPYYRELIDASAITTLGEAFAYHRRWLREQWDAYGRQTRLAFSKGALFSAGEYVAAQKVRRAVGGIVGRLFDEVDLVVGPTTAAGAPVLEGFTFAGLGDLIFTPYWSGIGHPAISVPMGFSSEGLPFGLQIAGRPFDEATLLQAADAYQRATDFHLQVPPLAAGVAPTEETRV